MIKKYKYTLIFITLSLLMPVAFTFSKAGIGIPFDLGIVALFDIFLLFLLRNKIELKKKKLLIFFPILLISILSPILLLFLFIFSPGQKEHDRVMYEICLPKLRQYYGIEDMGGFPMEPKDKNGNAKWWFQHLECEQNVYDGKGSTFSDNPPDFKPTD